MVSPWRRWVLPAIAAGRGLPGALKGYDLALLAAALTFYAAIALVPVVVLSAWAVAEIAGADRLRELAGAIAGALPATLGAPVAVRALAAAGIGLAPAAAIAAVFPASLYGEGLRRAFLSLTGGTDRWTGWRGRLLILPVLIATPGLLYALLFTAPAVNGLFAGGPAARALGIVLAFTVDWILVSLALVWTFRIVAPGAIGWPATVLGAFATGSFVAGFVQGFVLFLAIPVDLGLPFGGFRQVGAGVAIGLWLYLLHVVLLVGYAFTRGLDGRAAGDAAAR